MWRSFYNMPAKLYCFLFIAIAQFCFIAICTAQTSEKKDASFNHIDQLVDLSYTYFLLENKDSAKLYAGYAYNEGKRLNYNHGIARALLRKAQIAKHFDDDFKQSETFALQSLKWFDRSDNKRGLDTLYTYLIYNVLSQSRYEEGINYAEKLYELARQSNNAASIMEALAWEFAIYRQSGDYEKSFWCVQKTLEFATINKNKVWIANALYGMAQQYAKIEDYKNSLYYFRRVLEIDDDATRANRIATDNDIWFKMEFAEAFSHLGQFDSAWHYYNLFKPGTDKKIYWRVYWVSTGECHYLQGNYAQALQNFQLGLSEHQKLHDRNEVMRTLLNIGKTYMALGNNLQALHFGREGLNIALATKTKNLIRDGYQILSTVYDRLNQADSANYYFRQYIHMKETVLDDQAKGKFAAFTYQQKIALINKEKEMKVAELKNAAFIKKILIAGLVVLILFGAAMVRTINLKRKNERQQFLHNLEVQQLENEKAKTRLQQQSSELEMKALRAQMNPHFIFNSLNSINRFILENNKIKASEYLTKFSRLVRMILQNSQISLITLESELEALKLYIDLEALRFDHHFEYKLIIPEDLDIEVLKVPPLIIQPFVENAIWHGLMHKEEKGLLEIEVSQIGDQLLFRIADDGLGRKLASQIDSKSAAHKSIGLKITTARIAMLQESKTKEEAVSINDLVHPDGTAAGTEVILKMPAIYSGIDRTGD